MAEKEKCQELEPQKYENVLLWFRQWETEMHQDKTGSYDSWKLGSIPIIPAGRQRQEEQEFEASPGYILSTGSPWAEALFKDNSTKRKLSLKIIFFDTEQSSYYKNKGQAPSIWNGPDVFLFFCIKKGGLTYLLDNKETLQNVNNAFWKTEAERW